LKRCVGAALAAIGFVIVFASIYRG